MFLSQTIHFVVIDQAVFIHAVLHTVIALSGEVDFRTVGQVTAMRQAHAQHGIARIQQRHVHRDVGRRTRVRLHVGVIGTEQLLSAFDGQSLGHIDEFAAAVVTLARIAFGVLVGEHAALRFQHARAGVVLRSNQLDVVFLALALVGDGFGKFSVVLGNGLAAGEHGGSLGIGGRLKL